MSMGVISSANRLRSQREQDAESCAESFGRTAYRAVMRKAQSYFLNEKRKPSYELTLASGHPLRTVQSWFSDKHQGSASAMIALLLTDAAPEVLRTIRKEALAAGKTIPKFYDDLEAFVAVSVAMRAHEKSKKQAEELLILNDRL
jgi:hypothetical protein